MNDEFVELKIKDKTVKLPIRKASIGPNVIDVTKLYGKTSYFTYCPGDLCPPHHVHPSHPLRRRGEYLGIEGMKLRT